MNTFQAFTSESLLEIIDALPMAIAVIDRDRRVILINRRILKFTNKHEAHLIGHVGGEAFDCVNHDATPEGCGFGRECLKCKLRETLVNTITHKIPFFMVEAPMTFKNNEKRHLRISTSPLTLNSEDVVLLAIEDNTDAKIHEQALIEKEKLSAVLKTVGGICHELNQPLMIIQGFAELLLNDLSKEKAVSLNIQKLVDQVERLSFITRKLTSITRFKTKPYLNGEIIDIDAASELS